MTSSNAPRETSPVISGRPSPGQETGRTRFNARAAAITREKTAILEIRLRED
jgi:hypothetical protein